MLSSLLEILARFINSSWTAPVLAGIIVTFFKNRNDITGYLSKIGYEAIIMWYLKHKCIQKLSKWCIWYNIF